MRVLLIDVDSTFPNLALMKASAFHKAGGDQVELYQHRGRRTRPVDLPEGADLALVSCVFSWNRPIARQIGRWSGAPEVQQGGTGFDWGKEEGTWSQLDPRIEATRPDYDLYGDDRALGFCNRGCNRSCHFCVVWRKEGRIVPELYAPPGTWVPDGFTKALLLDNDAALYPIQRQREIFEWFRDAGVRWSLTQGYDVRVLAGENGGEAAGILADCHPNDSAFRIRQLYVAWDYLGIEPAVRRLGIQRLIAAGIPGKQICVYTVAGTPHARTGEPIPTDVYRASVLYRFRELRALGVLPYVMPFNRRKDDPWLNAFARFVNRRIFKSCDWEDYVYGRFRAADWTVPDLPPPDRREGL